MSTNEGKSTYRVVVAVSDHGALKNGRESLDLVGALSNVVTECVAHVLSWQMTKLSNFQVAIHIHLLHISLLRGVRTLHVTY